MGYLYYGRALLASAGGSALALGRSSSRIKHPHGQPSHCRPPQPHGPSHLSAMWSCLASSASLLKVFHIASVSGVISRVSKKAVALEREGTKAQGLSQGSGRHGGISGMGQGRGGISCLEMPSFTTHPRLLVISPAPHRV